MELKFLQSKPATVGLLAATVTCVRCKRKVRVRTMYPGQGTGQFFRCCGR